MNAGAAIAVQDAPPDVDPLYVADVVDEHGTTRRVEYMTAVQVAGRLPDVTAARLRTWCDPRRPAGQLLRAVTVAELAAEVFGLEVAGDEPARVAGPNGPANLYRYHEVTAAEIATRRAGRGRRRTGQYAAGVIDLVPAVRRRPALGERVLAVAGGGPVDTGGVCSRSDRTCDAPYQDPQYSMFRCQLPAHAPGTPHEARYDTRLVLWADA
ncbi:hypothetical protein [Dactylosporangium sp. CS-033363]|uniref:hypothetical protein n=1 Tax=Dactylosporangium sp. CS-033363 TaxID=3239935 RepID=UPI003D8C4071